MGQTSGHRGSITRRLDGLALPIGMIGLLVAGYALTGRAPDLFLMRGLGPRSLAIVAASEAAFLWALWRVVARAAHASRAPRRLAIFGAGASMVAIGVLLRHPLTGAFEFPHRDWELAATRAGLFSGALSFAAVWCWVGVARAITTGVPRDATGPELLRSIARLGWQRACGPVANLTLSLVAILSTLIVLEAATRLMEGAPLLSTTDLLAPPPDPLARSSLVRYDALLGWVQADDQRPDPGGTFSTGEYGVRMNSRAIAPVPRHAILAVGDSFTAGSGVSNWETWPAQLEATLGEPVVNAASGGWAADQIVLRAETLIAPLEPREIIVSFLADDILRAAYATYGGGSKPYFTTDGHVLVSHNVPVPRDADRSDSGGWLRALLGRSHLAVYVIRVSGNYERWTGGGYREIVTNVVDVSCLLLERLKGETDAKRIALHFVMQHGGDSVAGPDDEPVYARRVLACARQTGINTTDTWQPLRAFQRRDPAAFKTLYNMNERPGWYGHMTARGNALIAQIVAGAVEARPTRGAAPPR